LPQRLLQSTVRAMPHFSTNEIASAAVEDLIVGASDVPVLDDAEEARLAVRCAANDEARWELVRSHLRVAVDEAIRNRGLGARQEVLVREAVRALVEAAPDYDAVSHGSFASYARRIVRAAIGRAIAS
jgi:DNA-directed RNA polymerase sigma subunit (sigma70/sigma32)